MKSKLGHYALNKGDIIEEKVSSLSKNKFYDSCLLTCLNVYLSQTVSLELATSIGTNMF
jgi:hypothetical protein